MAHPEQMNFCNRIKARFPDDFSGKRVLDVGSMDINGNNRRLFTDCDYTGIDLGPGRNVDVVCPAHEHTGRYDTIISTEAFEHDPYLEKSLDHIVSHLLRPGGLFVFTCAGPGRGEHGTAEHTPEDSPYTHGHYCNVSENDIRMLIDLDAHFGESYEFSANQHAHDLYFVGRKAGGDATPCWAAWAPPGVSIIIPVIRPESARRCVEAIHRHAGMDRYRYEVLTANDHMGIGCPEMVRMLTNRTRHDLVMFLGDDTEPEAGFLLAALAAMACLPDGWGVVGLNTQGSVPYGHWLADKRMLAHIPGENFFPTEYLHGYCDRELYDIAGELGRWAWAEDARILHHHPVNGEAWDDDYRRIYDDDRMHRDCRTFQRRKQERIRARGENRFGICWPITNKILFTDFAISYAVLEKPPHKFYHPTMANQMDIDGGGSARQTVPEVKNELVHQALMDGITDLLTMDTDQTYLTPDMIRRMLSHGKPIVAARVHRRYPPFDPIMLQVEKIVDGEKFYRDMPFDEAMAHIERGDLVEVDNTGTGCVLYDTRVFLDVPPPWYEFGRRKNGGHVSADCMFHEKAVDAGYPIYVDASIDILHQSVKGIGTGDYQLEHIIQQQIERRKNGV